MSLKVVRLLVLILLCGCAKKQQQATPAEAAQRLTERSKQVQTVKGRAWVSIKSTTESATFSGIVVVDRTDVTKPGLRIEALDPFGGLHHLVVIQGAQSRMIWADFDGKRVHEGRHRWHGISLGLLPHFFAGAFTPESLRGMAVDYEWFDPGPQLGITRIQTTVPIDGKVSPVAVSYAHNGARKDFYLPVDMDLVAGADLELKLSWRERNWNEPVDAALFDVPVALTKGFKHDKLP